MEQFVYSCIGVERTEGYIFFLFEIPLLFSLNLNLKVKFSDYQIYIFFFFLQKKSLSDSIQWELMSLGREKLAFTFMKSPIQTQPFGQATQTLTKPLTCINAFCGVETIALQYLPSVQLSVQLQKNKVQQEITGKQRST